MVKGAYCLHGPLTEGLRTDHQAAAVVLNGPGKNLRSGSAHPVHQHHHGAIPGDAGILISQHLNPVVRTADLNRGSTVDKQSYQVVGLVKGTATVIAQVDNQTVDVL